MKKIIKAITGRFATGAELMRFFWESKLGWMIPVVMLLLAVGFLMIFAQSTPIAPFIYTIF